ELVLVGGGWARETSPPHKILLVPPVLGGAAAQNGRNTGFLEGRSPSKPPSPRTFCGYGTAARRRTVPQSYFREWQRGGKYAKIKTRQWAAADLNREEGHDARTYRAAGRKGSSFRYPALLRYCGRDAGCDLARHRRTRFRHPGRHSRRRHTLARRRAHGLHLELGLAGTAARAGRAPGAPLRCRLRSSDRAS